MLIGAIVGATGVGKTEVAIEVAKMLGAELICMDSRQVHAGMAIGTAQPTLQQQAHVKHHLVGFLPPSESYSAARFSTDVARILAEHPNTRFLLVGGTGLYLQVLCEGLSELPPSDPILRERLEVVAKRRGMPFLYRWMSQIDPGAILHLRPNDSHRILRVLEAWLLSGQRWSESLGDRRGGIGPVPTLWLDRERSELYGRIDERVTQMIEAGWLDEVAVLCTQVSLASPGMLSLGYQELGRVHRGELDLAGALSEIRQKTRNYAKRQLTWFRNKTHVGLKIEVQSGEIDSISMIQEFFQKNLQESLDA